MIAVRILQSIGGTVDGKLASYADGDETEMSEASVEVFEAAGIVERIERPAVRVPNPPAKASRKPAVKSDEEN